MQQAVEGAAVEGGAVIAVGKATELISSALSKVSAKVAEKAAAKEPVKPLPDEVLEKIAGGAKDPGWRPTGSTTKTASKVWDYSEFFDRELINFNDGFVVKDTFEKDMILVQYSSGSPSASLKYWTTVEEANGIHTVNEYMDRLAISKTWGNRDVVKVARIVKGTKVKHAIGTAKKQTHIIDPRFGGGTQILFSEFNTDWITEIREFR